MCLALSCEDKDGAGADEDDDLEALRARRRKQMKALGSVAGILWGMACPVPYMGYSGVSCYLLYDMIFMICVYLILSDNIEYVHILYSNSILI